MEIITTRMRARKAADSWKRQYFVNGQWNNVTMGNSKDIWQNLVDLGANPDPEAVNSVIGNRSWTWVKCDECGSDTDMVVQVGEPPDYESATACLCSLCISNAFELANM